MNNIQIKWKSFITNFTGRNGYFKCSGVDLQPIDFDLPSGPKVMISPITSKDGIGNCDIQVPYEDIPELIRGLQEILDKHKDNA